MSEQAATILKAMRDLRAGRINADEYRATMADLRQTLGEHRYLMAKMAACAADLRRIDAPSMVSGSEVSYR